MLTVEVTYDVKIRFFNLLGFFLVIHLFVRCLTAKILKIALF